MCLRACATASISKPANTAVNLSGIFPVSTAIFIPGRAAPAAHPHTEFTTIKTVPLLFSIALSTASGVVKSSKPTAFNSAFIGLTNCSGYIFSFLIIVICTILY